MIHIIPRIIDPKRKRKQKKVNIDSSFEDYCEYVEDNIHLIIEFNEYCGFQYDVFMKGYEPLEEKKEIIDTLLCMNSSIKSSFITLDDKIKKYPLNTDVFAYKSKKQYYQDFQDIILDIYKFLIEDMKHKFINTNEDKISLSEYIDIILKDCVDCSVEELEYVEENINRLKDTFKEIEKNYEKLKDLEHITKIIEEHNIIEELYTIYEHADDLIKYFSNLEYVANHLLSCNYE